MNLFYRIFYKGFLKYHESTKSIKDNLVYAFTDSSGNKYHTWPDSGQLPKCRYDKLMDLTIWWEAKISPDTAEQLADGIIMATEHSLTSDKVEDKSKHLSKVIVFANELKRRKEGGIPSVIAYEMAAVWAVREDEDPKVFNAQIHEEKIDMFAGEAAHGRDFFLMLPQLIAHLNLWQVSRTGLRKLFAESERKDSRQSAILDHLLSDYASATTTKASAD